MLIEKGANVNAVDYCKITPLHNLVALDTLSHGHEDWTEDDYLSNFQFQFCF